MGLLWDFQVDYVTKKLRSLLSLFRFYRKIFSLQQMLVLYYALAQSHLTHGLIAWGGVTKTYLKKLDVVQKWLLKIIYNKNRLYPSEALFADTGILDVRLLYFQIISNRLYKKKIIVQSIQHSHDTRHRQNSAVKPQMKKTIGQRCFLYLSTSVYERIAYHLRAASSFLIFKKQIKKMLSSIDNRHAIYQILDEKNFYIT